MDFFRIGFFYFFYLYRRNSLAKLYVCVCMCVCVCVCFFDAIECQACAFLSLFLFIFVRPFILSFQDCLTNIPSPLPPFFAARQQQQDGKLGDMSALRGRVLGDDEAAKYWERRCAEPGGQGMGTGIFRDDPASRSTQRRGAPGRKAWVKPPPKPKPDPNKAKGLEAKRNFLALKVCSAPCSVNSSTRQYNIKYNRFIYKLKQSKIILNRKMLSQLEILDPLAFSNIIEINK